MFLQRIQSSLILAGLVVLVLLPTNFAAQETCDTSAQQSYARALQAQDHVLFDNECAGECSDSVTYAVASYERAVMQAEGHVMVDIRPADCGMGDPASISHVPGLFQL